jgi:hypothetical protein
VFGGGLKPASKIPINLALTLCTEAELQDYRFVFTVLPTNAIRINCNKRTVKFVRTGIELESGDRIRAFDIGNTRAWSRRVFRFC